MKRIALAAIRGYQRYLSPYKGFVCSYRAHTGGASCSAYGHAVIGRYGVLCGWALLRRRMQRCAEVYQAHAIHPRSTRRLAPALRRQAGHIDLDCGDAEACACGLADVCDDWPCDFGESRRKKRKRREEERYVDIAPNSRLVIEDTPPRKAEATPPCRRF